MLTLTSQFGIRLILQMGAHVPLPPPADVLTSLTEVEVSSGHEEQSPEVREAMASSQRHDDQDGFRLTFTLGRDFDDWGFFSRGVAGPGSRVIVGVVMGLIPEVLIDGIVTHHQLRPSNQPGQSTVVITGLDVSQAMNLEERSDTHPNQPDHLIFTKLIGSYARFGLVPNPVPTADVPLIIQRLPAQTHTDLGLIRAMARRNGYVFYVDPVTFGVNRAYFGPELRVGLPQRALNMNMGAETNVTELTFGNDFLAPTSSSGSFIEGLSGQIVPLPALPPARIPLSSSPQAPMRTTRLRCVANQQPTTAFASAMASSLSSADPVRGRGELDAVRYGGVLRPRRLVGVRGVGRTYDGNYLVEKVTHVLTRQRYVQRFSIRRDGTGAQLPVVVP